MAGFNERIKTAVFSRTAALEQLMGLPINWDKSGQEFRVPADGRYLRVNLMRNTSRRLFINSATHQRLAILQISIIVPLSEGWRIEGLSDQVVAHYPMDLRMTAGDLFVRVMKEADAADPLKDDPSWNCPVSVNLECLA